MSYKFNLYKLFRFNRNTNNVKQQEVEDKLVFVDKANADINAISNSLDNVAREAYNDAGKAYSNRSAYKMLLVALAEVVNFTLLYIYRIVNNFNILTTDNEIAVKGLASLTGFDAINVLAARGSINVLLANSIYNNTTLLIQNGAQLTNKSNGLKYTVVLDKEIETVSFKNTNSVQFNVVQGYRQQMTYTGNGQSMQSFAMTDKNIDRTMFAVYVNDSICRQVNKLSDMRKNELSCIIKNNLDGSLTVHFGNKSNGYIPKLTDNIVIFYISADGTMGNCNANDIFTFDNGVTNAAGEFIDTKQTLTIFASYDFIGGYDGDDIETVRLNAGLQTSSNAIVTVDNYYAFMRKYNHINVVDIWSEPSINNVNMLVAPNLRTICNDKLCTYFDLEYSDFEMDDDERSQLHDNIVTDKIYSLMSSLQLYSYHLEPFAIMIFANINKFNNVDSIYSQTTALLHEALLSAYDEHAQQIKASKIANVLQDNVAEFNTIKVQFIGDAKYIDVFGDIDCRNKLVTTNKGEEVIVPFVTKGNYNNVPFLDIPFKILTSSGNNNWYELNTIKND